MKNFVLAACAVALVSCNKVEEKINATIDKTTQSVKQKAEQQMKQTLEESINKMTNSENIESSVLYPTADPELFSNFKGRKVVLPTGGTYYIFKYTSNRDSLISFLESQPTTDESKSTVKATKIDGQTIISQISILEKFLPESILGSQNLEEIKTDKNIEFYNLKRFPYNSTLIYNPEKSQFFQLVEVVK